MILTYLASILQTVCFNRTSLIVARFFSFLFTYLPLQASVSLTSSVWGLMLFHSFFLGIDSHFNCSIHIPLSVIIYFLCSFLEHMFNSCKAVKAISRQLISTDTCARYLGNKTVRKVFLCLLRTKN